MAAEEKWYFSKEYLLNNSPSRRCGCSADKELSYRQQAANFIQDMGQKLQVTQLCINTAIVYMHRFYVFHSFTQFHRNAIAAAALFLAAKVEEQPRKLEHVIKVAHMCLHRDHRDIPPLDTKSEQYLEQAQDLVFNENVLLQTLGFDVAIDHPHTHVVRCCELVRASKDLAQTSYFMASNSLHLTTMCLQYKPTIVACFCIHLACKWSNWQIPLSIEGKKWFWYVDKSVTLEQLERLTSEFLIIFDKCPTKLKRKIKSIKKENAPFPTQNINSNLFADPRKAYGPDGQEGSSSSHHHPHQPPDKSGPFPTSVSGRGEGPDELEYHSASGSRATMKSLQTLLRGAQSLPPPPSSPSYSAAPEDAYKKSQQAQSSGVLRHTDYPPQQIPPPHQQHPHQRADARDYREKKDREKFSSEGQVSAPVPSSRDGGHHGGAALQNLHHKAVPPKVGAPASHHRPPGSAVSMSRDAARREQAQIREASKRESLPREMLFTSRGRHDPALDSSEPSGSQQNHLGSVVPSAGSSSAGRNEWPVDGEARDERHGSLPGDKRGGGGELLRHSKVSNEHGRMSQALGENNYKDSLHGNTYNHRQDHIRHRSEQYHPSSQVNSDSVERKHQPELGILMDRKPAPDINITSDRKSLLDLMTQDRKPPSEPSSLDRKMLSEPSNLDRKLPHELNSVVDRKLQPELNNLTDRKSELSSVIDRHDSSKRLPTNVHSSHHVPTTKREVRIEENLDVKPRAISNSIPINKQKSRSGSPVVGQSLGQSSSSSHRSKSPNVSVQPQKPSSSQLHHHHSVSVRNGPVPEEHRMKRPEQPIPFTPKLLSTEHTKMDNDSAASQTNVSQAPRSSTPVGHKGHSTPEKPPHSVRESPYPQRSAKSKQRTPPSSVRRPPLLETPTIPPVSSGGGLTSPFGSPPPPLPTTPGKPSAANNPSASLRTTRHRSSSSSSEPELIPVVTKLDDIAGYENIIHETKIKLPGRVPDIIQPIRDRKKDESVHGTNSKTTLATSVAKELKPPDLIRPFPSQVEAPENQHGDVGPVTFSPSPLDFEVPDVSSKQSVDLNASLESVIDVTSITEPLPTLPLVDESALGATQVGSASPSKKSSDHHHRSDKKKKKEKHKHKEKDKSRDKDDKDRKHKHKHKDKDRNKTDRSVDVMPAAEPIKITIPKDKLVNMTPTLEQNSSGSSGIKLKIQKERLKDLPQTTSNMSHSTSSGGLKIKITGINSSNAESSRKRDRSSPGDESSAAPTKSARLSSSEHSKRSASGSHSKQNSAEGQRGRGSSQYAGNKGEL
ncbi:cyclin-T isoform X1 [Bacillus rossius redtenbacheri]|uniref:cyclin-T isoform X1 n=1 Tax=Bacillus rossius redtenbacheri TaxID=93214 RepID=UPI002FDE096B